MPTKLILNIAVIICFISLNTFAQDTKVLLQQVKIAMDNNKFDEAIQILNGIINREPSNEEALTQRARSFIILKNVSDASADADKVLAINPNSTFALNVRGMVKGANRDFNGAIADFTQAVTLDQTFFRSYYQRAKAKIFLNDNISSIFGDFDLAIKYSNEDLGILQDAGNYCLDLNGAPNFCAVYFSKIKTKASNSAVGYLGYALAYSNDFLRTDGRIFQAENSFYKGEIVENFRKAMELDPINKTAPLQLARLLFNLDDFDGAIATLNKAVLIDPKDAFTFALLGDNYRIKKDYDEAIANYSKAIELNPELRDAYKFRAKTRYQKWRDPNLKVAPELEYYSEMYKDFVKWIEFYPNDYNEYKDFDRYDLGLFNKDDFYKKQIAENPKNVCAAYFLYEGAGMGKLENWKSVVDNYDGKNGAKCASDAALQLGRIYADGADDYQKFPRDYIKAEEYYNLATKFDPSARQNANNWIARLPKELKGTPITVDSESSNSTKKMNGANNARILKAIDAYDIAHKNVEDSVKIYVDASNKLTKAGAAASFMNGTKTTRYKAQYAAIREIEELLDKHGKYLPKELVEHILEDYALVYGTRNFDYLLSEN